MRGYKIYSNWNYEMKVGNMWKVNVLFTIPLVAANPSPAAALNELMWWW